MATVTGYSEFSRTPDGRTFALAHYSDGERRRCEVRVSVERSIDRVDGSHEPAREVASSDDGSVRVAEGATL